MWCAASWGLGANHENLSFSTGENHRLGSGTHGLHRASCGRPFGLVYRNAEGGGMTWRVTFAREDGTEDWTYAAAGDAYDAMRAVNWVLGRVCALKAELAW